MMKHYVRLACFVGGALFGSAGNDCFDFILAVPGTQCL